MPTGINRIGIWTRFEWCQRSIEDASVRKLSCWNGFSVFVRQFMTVQVLLGPEILSAELAKVLSRPHIPQLLQCLLLVLHVLLEDVGRHQRFRENAFHRLGHLRNVVLLVIGAQMQCQIGRVWKDFAADRTLLMVADTL